MFWSQCYPRSITTIYDVSKHLTPLSVQHFHTSFNPTMSSTFANSNRLVTLKMIVFTSMNIASFWFSNFILLVACYATLHPALSVHPSVCQLVYPSHFYFFYDFYSLTTLPLPKWSSDLTCGPCPPACD